MEPTFLTASYMPGTVLDPGEYGSRNWWFRWGDKKPNKSNPSWLGYWCLYSCPRVVLTKYHKLKGLTTEMIISKFWRLEAPNQGVVRVGFLWAEREDLCPLTAPGALRVPWLVSGILPVSAHPLSSVYACFCVQISSFGQNTVDTGLWATLWSLFHLTSCQDPISKLGHIPRH